MIAARRIFESFAGYSATSLPPDLHPIDALQLLLSAWQAHNFDGTSDVLTTLGIGEEIGEMADAATREEIDDAIGDVAIHCCQLATSNRLAFRALVDDGGAFADPIESHLGRLCHLVLKREQRIRSGRSPVEMYRSVLADAIAGLLGSVRAARARRPISSYFTKTAADVLRRDWRAYPITGMP